MAVQALNTTNFEEIVKNSTVPVLVDFYADWCKPCKRIAPTLEEISSERDGEVLVCKVDVDHNQGIASAYQVMSIPNIISFKNGSMYKRAQGAISKADLLALVE